MFEIKTEIELDKVSDILKRHGLQDGGPVQKYFTSRILAYVDPYVPMQTGMLKNNVSIGINGDCIIYNKPYSKYHWFGLKMVDPKYEIGAFHNDLTGRFWSRPGIPKKLTNEPMEYKNGPLRGPKWVNRMWADKSDDIMGEMQAYVDRGAK